MEGKEGRKEGNKQGRKETSKEARKEGRKEDHYGGMQELIRRNNNERIAPEKEVIIFVPLFFRRGKIYIMLTLQPDTPERSQ